MVTECGAPHAEWTAPELTLPAITNALYRARAAVHMASGTVTRLDALDVVDAPAADARRIAGFAVSSGTEVSLPNEQLPALAEWLSGEGFDDRVVRRCKRGAAYGIRATRDVPGGQEVTEINYGPTLGFYGETNAVGGKEIAIGPLAFRWGRWTVLGTLIHELAHSNGAPGGASAAAEEALLHCGLGRLSEKHSGTDDRGTPYEPGISG